MRRDLTRYVPAAILLVGALGLLKSHAQHAIPLGQPLTKALAPIPGYDVIDQKIGNEERRVAGMNDYSARVYRRDSAVAFTTLVTYYEAQSQGKTIHSPRNCLPGAGWEILTAGHQVIDVAGKQFTVNRNILKNGALTSIVYYWYQGRGRLVASEYTVKWNLLRDAAVLGHTEESLVRVVVPVKASAAGAAGADQAQSEAFALGETVVRKMVTDVGEVLPKG